MSRPKMSAIREEFAGYFAEGNVAILPVDRKPIETCQIMSKCDKHFTNTYIPSAFSVSVSMTRSLSLSLHLLIAVSESA